MNESVMLPCDEVIAQLWEYLDGELSAEREARVRAHLEACARCFPHYDFERAFLELLRRQGHEGSASLGLRQRVFASLLAETHRPGAPGAALTPLTRPARIIERASQLWFRLFGVRPPDGQR